MLIPKTGSRTPRRILAALALLCLGPTLALAQDRPAIDVEAEWAAVRAANQRFVRAERSGSLDSIAAAMWPGAVLLPPRQLEVRGHEAILARLTSGTPPAPVSEAAPGGGTVVNAGGDMAVTWGTGGEGAGTFKFMSVVEKRAGEWKLLLNAFNPRPARTPGEVAEDEPGVVATQDPRSEQAGAVRAAVDAANRRFQRAERSGSLDSISVAMWPDAVILPPGRRWGIEGHDEIFAFVTPGLTPDSTKSYAPRRTRLLSPGGDMAVLGGPGCWVEHGPDGPIPHHFKFVTVLDKRDGEWKVLLNMWNSRSAPEPGAGCRSG